MSGSEFGLENNKDGQWEHTAQSDSEILDKSFDEKLVEDVIAKHDFNGVKR